MPIEFRCTQCGKLLRTPDDSSGQSARCPECDTLLAIPMAGSVPPPAQPVQQPWQAASAPTTAPSRRPFKPTRIDFGDVFSKAWNVFTKNLLLLMLPVAVIFVVMVSAFIAMMSIAALNPGGEPPVGPLLLIYFTFFLTQMYLTLGVMSFNIKVARGEPAGIGDILGGGPSIVPAIGVWLTLMLGFGALAVTCIGSGALLGYLVSLGAQEGAMLGFLAGAALFYVPVFIFGLMFSMALPLVIDRHVGVFESLTMSKEATQGNKLMMFAIYLVSHFGASILTVVTCYIGGIFVYPFILQLFTVTYLTMTGQGTVGDPVAQATVPNPATNPPAPPPPPASPGMLGPAIP